LSHLRRAFLILSWSELVLVTSLVCADTSLADDKLSSSSEHLEPVRMLTPAENEKLDQCAVQAVQAVGDDQQRRVMVGVYIGVKGEATSVAVLESSGLEALDERVLRCVRRAKYRLVEEGKGPLYLILKSVLKPKSVQSIPIEQQ
jgi:TonB family protein